ncbi:3-dehydroquinate synthase [Porphyridium purpureum]|uniref:3-dehydroquinate synthase n=1 Tax=Porphyridium purpureum TaxID=35688 RepID=A0A5J4YVZ6_PORPP|nr:3-dehydroquinate synthase [Porphyridium purpureum]|eukprot:POR8945..scf209_3
MLTANNFQAVHVVDKSPLVAATVSKPEQKVLVKQKEAPVTAHFGRYHKKMETDVIVKDGILMDFRHYAKSVLPEDSHLSKNYLVTDRIVDELYGDQVLNEMRAAGLDVEKLVMPADNCDESGESSAEMHKTLKVLSWMIDSILDMGIDKHSCIVSLGGGVVNNLCGFLASSLYRGISLVHITTTMMGQSDAAIDFKQAVNHPRGKNLVGSYYPASKVVCDPATLTTLSDRHLLNGLSECIKHAITQSKDMLDFILDGIHDMRNTKYLEAVVRMTVEHKAPTLTDYHDSDFNEMCPQYGHAIGHAVEHLSWHEGFGPALLHGEAIAIGMCVSAEIAYIMDLCDEAVVDKHYEIFEKAALPVHIPSNMTLDLVLEKLTYDKHYLRCKPTMGLVTDIGNMHLDEENMCYGIKIDEEILLSAMEANVERRCRS